VTQQNCQRDLFKNCKPTGKSHGKEPEPRKMPNEMLVWALRHTQFFGVQIHAIIFVGQAISRSLLQTLKKRYTAIK